MAAVVRRWARRIARELYARVVGNVDGRRRLEANAATRGQPGQQDDAAHP